MNMGNKRLKWIRLILWILIVAMGVTIFSLSAQEGPESSAASDAVVRFIIQMIDPDFDALPEADQISVFAFVKKLVRKGAHFAEFAMLGCLIRLLISSYGLRCGTRWSWLAGTLYACTDELHQLFVSARAAMWQDVALDSFGVLAGIMAAHMMLVLLDRYGKRRTGT